MRQFINCDCNRDCNARGSSTSRFALESLIETFAFCAKLPLRILVINKNICYQKFVF